MSLVVALCKHPSHCPYRGLLSTPILAILASHTIDRFYMSTLLSHPTIWHILLTTSPTRLPSQWLLHTIFTINRCYMSALQSHQFRCIMLGFLTKNYCVSLVLLTLPPPLQAAKVASPATTTHCSWPYYCLPTHQYTLCSTKLGNHTNCLFFHLWKAKSLS